MKCVKLLLLILTVACSGVKENKKENSNSDTREPVLNVYSHRHYEADKQIFKRFSKETGIKINLVKAGADELISRLEMEGKNSPADVLITVDVAKLNRAKAMGLLQSIQINTNHKDGFVDPENYWYGISYRARIIAYNKENIDVSELSTYENLTDKKWNGRILIRSSSSSYNQSLLSSIIYENGLENGKAWAKGIVENMARNPKGGDRDQIKAIASGLGDLAVVNTYYVGLMLNSKNPEEVKAGERVGIFFPNQDGRGGHINISGIGVIKYAPNKANAIKFIEFLTSEEIQKFYAETSFEYPIHKKVAPASTISDWGDFKIDNLEYATNPELLKKAIKIFDEVGWN